MNWSQSSAPDRSTHQKVLWRPSLIRIFQQATIHKVLSDLREATLWRELRRRLVDNVL